VTRARVAAGTAGILTALLLQATLVGPVVTPWAASLPAVLVAAVALADGPATGMSFGFATGLVADLASRHPAGILALCWLGVGLVCGAAGTAGRMRSAVVAGCVTGAAGALAGVLLVVVHQGGTLQEVVAAAVPSLVVDVVLAVAVVPLVRRMLRADSLRAPHPVLSDVTLGGGRG
jgi:cell shape-determining protein MreD